MLKNKFVTNKKGKITAVIVPVKQYNQLLAKSEDLADILAFDNVTAKIKNGREQFVSFQEVLNSLNG